MNFFSVYKGLDKRVYILSGYRLIVGMGYFVIPYLSLYLTGELNISVGKTGLIIAAANLVCIPLVHIGGYYCSRVGYERWTIITQTLSASLYIFVIYVNSILLKIILIVNGFCISSMATPAMDACISRCTIQDERQRAFSLMYLCQNIGVAIGSLIVGSVYKKNTSFVFIGDAATTLIGTALLCWFFMRRDTDDCRTYSMRELSSNRVDRKSIIKKYNKKSIFAVVLINALSYGQLSFLLPLYLDYNLGEKSALMYGILMMINALCVIICSPILTQVFSKIKIITSLLCGELLFSIGYGIYIVSERSGFLFFATMIWSLGEILFSISHMAFIIDGVDHCNVGVLSATTITFNKIGSVLSSVLGASIILLLGYEYSWGLISALMFGAFCIVLSLKKVESEDEIKCKKN